jgi:hypothetical protein
MRSGAANSAVPLMRGSKRKGELSSGAPIWSGAASASWNTTRTGLSREIVPLVKAAIAVFSTSLSSPRSRGFFAREHVTSAAAAATAPARHTEATKEVESRRIATPARRQKT